VRVGLPLLNASSMDGGAITRAARLRVPDESFAEARGGRPRRRRRWRGGGGRVKATRTGSNRRRDSDRIFHSRFHASLIGAVEIGTGKLRGDSRESIIGESGKLIIAG